jgi:hypothetical protein
MPDEHFIALHEELATAEQNLADAHENVTRAERIVERAKDAIERWEGVHPDQARRRRHLRRLWMVPISIGGAAGLAKKISQAPGQAAAIGGSVLLAAAAITYAVIQTPHPRPHAAPPRPTLTMPTSLPQPSHPASRTPRPNPMMPTGSMPATAEPLPGVPVPVSSSTTISPAPSVAPGPGTSLSIPSVPSVRARRCIVIDLGRLADVRASIRLLDRGVLCVHPPLR